jgi:hypothetical protein
MDIEQIKNKCKENIEEENKLAKGSHIGAYVYHKGRREIWEEVLKEIEESEAKKKEKTPLDRANSYFENRVVNSDRNWTSIRGRGFVSWNRNNTIEMALPDNMATSLCIIELKRILTEMGYVVNMGDERAADPREQTYVVDYWLQCYNLNGDKVIDASDNNELTLLLDAVMDLEVEKEEK